MLRIERIDQPTEGRNVVLYRAAYGKHHAWNLCPLIAAANVLWIAAGKSTTEENE